MAYGDDSDDEFKAILGGVIAIIAAVIFGLSLRDCGGDEALRAGFVVSRNYHPPYTTTVCHRVGKSTICTPIHHPERFSLTLADGEHDERVVDMERNEWHQHTVGSWMCLHAPPCEHPRDDANGH